MHPYLAEFLGTLLLVFMGNSAVANVTLPRTKGHGGGWIVITFGYAMAVFVGVWCVAPFSGAHLNPAVTLGLAAAGKFTPAVGTRTEDIFAYVAAQFAGAFCSAGLTYFFYRDHYAACDDPATKLGTLCTAPAIRRNLSNVACEAIGTAVLVLAVLLAAEPSITVASGATGAFQPETLKIGLGTLGALPVALLVFSIGLSLGGLVAAGIWSLTINTPSIP